MLYSQENKNSTLELFVKYLKRYVAGKKTNDSISVKIPALDIHWSINLGKNEPYSSGISIADSEALEYFSDQSSGLADSDFINALVTTFKKYTKKEVKFLKYKTDHIFIASGRYVVLIIDEIRLDTVKQTVRQLMH